MMGRILAFAYGLVSYAVFFSSFLYSVGFVGNKIVPKSIDSGGPVAHEQALVIDILLLSLFAIQHSVMARSGFKRWWTRFVPEPVERSTYVLLSGLVFFLLFWQWRPMAGTVWDIENGAGALVLTVLFWTGWVLVVISSNLVNHFDLFGLRQVYLYLKGSEYTAVEFKQPLLYKVVRHPLMLGFIIAFWSSPRMTAGHLLFSGAMTVYTLIGIWFEERDLARAFGSAYEAYRQRVRMLLPVPKK